MAASGAGSKATPATLTDILAAFPGRGGAVAVRAYDAQGRATELSYAQLAAATAGAGAAWAALGVTAGDRVVLCAPPGPDWLVAALGALHIGAVPLPLDVQTDAGTLAHIVADSAVRAAYAGDAVLADPARAQTLAGLARYAPDASAPATSNTAPVSRAAQDIAVLFYTSGTTAHPKGVPLTHANLAFQVRALRERGIVGPGDRVLVPLPLHHVYPFSVGLLVPLGLGLTIIFPAGLGGPELRQAMHDGAATVLLGVPRLYRALADTLDARLAGAPAPLRALFGAALRRSAGGARGAGMARRVLAPVRRAIGPRMRLFACGGAPLDADVHARLAAVGFEVGVGYGLTETAPLLTLSLGECGPGSVGHPLPGVELRIAPGARPEVLPEGVDPAAVGELEVRGPGVFGAYLPSASGDGREAFTPDGWFRTGDMAYRDADGCVFLLGRVATLIMTAAGKKFDPEPVEAVYQGHAALREVALLGDDGHVAAVIVPAPELGSGPAREAAVRAALRETASALASYQRIERYVLATEPLARTPLGKLRRGEVKKLYHALRAGMTAGTPTALPEAQLQDPRARAAWDILTAQFPAHALTAQTDLRLDLGVDSIGWVSLTLALEERGIHLPEHELDGVNTVEDFLAAAQHAGQALAGDAPAPTQVDALSQDRLRPPPAWLQPLRALALGLASVVLRLGFGLRVERAGALPDGPCLIAPNHASYLDAPALCVALGWRGLRGTAFVGWAGIMQKGLLMRAVSRLARVLPVDPDRRPVAAIAAAQAALDAGLRLVWFPEGRRSADGALQALRPGIAMLIERRPVPVVPVWIDGAHAILPPGARWPRRGRIRVRIGAPLPPPAPGTPVDAISASVERALRALAPPAR